jgi:hypothetical protein
MTLGDFVEMADERQNINDYADFELLTADGLRITGITIDVREGVIYLSDTKEGVTVI